MDEVQVWYICPEGKLPNGKYPTYLDAFEGRLFPCELNALRFLASNEQARAGRWYVTYFRVCGDITPDQVDVPPAAT